MPVQVASHVLHGHPREVPEVPPRLRGEAVHQRHFEVDGVVRIGPVGLGRCTPETALPSLMAVKLQEGWGGSTVYQARATVTFVESMSTLLPDGELLHRGEDDVKHPPLPSPRC